LGKGSATLPISVMPWAAWEMGKVELCPNLFKFQRHHLLYFSSENSYSQADRIKEVVEFLEIKSFKSL